MNGFACQQRERRGRFHGVAQIVAFNWPKYALAIPLLGVLAVGPPLLELPPAIVAATWAITAALAWWALASLAASHWVYDRAGLYELDWLQALVAPPRRWASIHAGLDEFSLALRGRFGLPPLAVLDIYNRDMMPERSIARARARHAAHAAAPTDYRNLPLPDSTCDGIFLILAAHELRALDARCALFAEVRRALAPRGRVIVVEHLRDAWNFAAFGPGFLHFFACREWLSTFAAAGLRVETERPITPLVRVFVLERTES